MNPVDYFFLIFLGTITLIRLFLLTKMASPTIKGFRLRHYMYGIPLIIIAFLFNNILVYAIGLGLFVDELPLILIKGPGHKEKYWNGCGDYYSPWCVAGVFVFVLIVYMFRSAIVEII